jgi:hypothetical protein
MQKQLYYLAADTDHDTHDDLCCCGIQSGLPHKAIGASLYKLDIQGLQALHNLLTGKDEESFHDWCNQQESQGTYYGLNSEDAIEEALRQALQDGWLVINYPKSFPWIAPLVGALCSVIGNEESGDSFLKDITCECNNTRPFKFGCLKCSLHPNLNDLVIYPFFR